VNVAPDHFEDSLREKYNIRRFSKGSCLIAVHKWLWDWGATPGQLIRGLGPWAKYLVEKYVGKRFSRYGDGLTPGEADVFKHYVYHTQALPGSGEHALKYLLAPFAWARIPLGPLLHQLRVPTTFIYGEKDWMDYHQALAHCEQALQIEDVQNLRKRGDVGPDHLAVKVIKEAGHFPFLERCSEFSGVLANVVVVPPQESSPSPAGETKVLLKTPVVSSMDTREVIPAVVPEVDVGAA